MFTKRELINNLSQYDKNDVTHVTKSAEIYFGGITEDALISYDAYLEFFVKNISGIIDVDESEENYKHAVILFNSLFRARKPEDDDTLLKAFKNLKTEGQFNPETLSLVSVANNPVKLAEAFVALKGLTANEKTNLSKVKEANFDKVVKALKDAENIKDNIVTNQAIIDSKSPEEFVEVLKKAKYSGEEIKCLASSNAPKNLSESLQVLQKLRLNGAQIKTIIEKPEDADIIYTIKALGHIKTNQNALWSDESINKIIDHPRPKFVTKALEYLTQSKGQNKLVATDLDEIKEDRFKNWRTDETVISKSKKPDIPIGELGLPAYLEKAVKDKLMADYRSSLPLMEYSLADLSLEYVGERKGSKAESNLLLDFSKEYSQRYLELMEAYVSLDIDKGIPMLPVEAGQMKLHGYTSQQILDLRPICKDYCNEVVPLLKAVFPSPLSLSRSHDLDTLTMMLHDRSWDIKRSEILTSTREDLEKKTGISLSPESHQKFIEACKKMVEVGDRPVNKSQAWELGQAHFLMHDFAHMSLQQMADQLDAVANLPVDPKKLVLGVFALKANF